MRETGLDMSGDICGRHEGRLEWEEEGVGGVEGERRGRSYRGRWTGSEWPTATGEGEDIYISRAASSTGIFPSKLYSYLLTLSLR